MFHREFGKDQCARGRLASETRFVILKAFILAVLTDQSDQGDCNLHCEEDHPEAVHASFESKQPPNC